MPDQSTQQQRLSRRPSRSRLRVERPAGDGETEIVTASVTLHRKGHRAWVRVTGQLNVLTRRHLDDWLDWLITTGARHITVSLATAEQIDAACLLVLRVARARLQSKDGELLVTAGRAPVRAELHLLESAS